MAAVYADESSSVDKVAIFHHIIKTERRKVAEKPK